MTVYIVKYKLNKDGTIPSYIRSGGYFPDGDELYGLTKNLKTKPTDCTIIDLSELNSLINDTEMLKPDFSKTDGSQIALTTTEKAEYKQYILSKITEFEKEEEV